MKFSQFNSIIRLSEKLSLVYNAYADSYLILSNKYLPLGNIESIKKIIRNYMIICLNLKVL